MKLVGEIFLWVGAIGVILTVIYCIINLFINIRAITALIKKIIKELK